MDELTIDVVRDWRLACVDQRRPKGRKEKPEPPKPLAAKTVANALDHLSQALWLAVDRGYITSNPVDVFRRSQRRRRTKGSVQHEEIRILPSLEAIEAIVKAAEAEGPRAHGVVLHAIDAGLRFGEIRGRRWEDHVFGRDRSDRRRSLLIRANHPTGGVPGERTKTGRTRRVHMSRRLRVWLLEELARRGNPKSGPVFDGLDASNFAKTMATICKSAGLGGERYTLLDARHSFASHLLQLGWGLDYISSQLGNSPGICRRHYARWVTDEFVEPPRLEAGEVPADLLALRQAAAEARVNA